MKQVVSIIALFAIMVLNVQAMDSFMIEIKDHKFTPAGISLPADQKVKLIVKNLDATPEEFESHDLHREKLIHGNGKAVIYVGPLKPGIYKFIGEFNPKTALGRITVK